MTAKHRPGSCSYVGIDPGQNGGIALHRDGVMRCHAMPSTEYDIYECISTMLGPYDGPIVGLIEQVHAMPKQGVSSTFKFGCGYGGLRMALIAAGIPFEEVTPRKWQKALGITPREKTESKSEFKQRLKAKAQQLFPNVDVTLKTCDALLIAEYCRRKELGLLK